MRHRGLHSSSSSRLPPVRVVGAAIGRHVGPPKSHTFGPHDSSHLAQFADPFWSYRQPETTFAAVIPSQASRKKVWNLQDRAAAARDRRSSPPRIHRFREYGPQNRIVPRIRVHAAGLFRARGRTAPSRNGFDQVGVGIERADNLRAFLQSDEAAALRSAFKGIPGGLVWLPWPAVGCRRSPWSTIV